MVSKKTSDAGFWRQHITKYKASGQTRAEYCKVHGLKVHQLAYYVGLQNKAGPGTSSFATVAIADDPVPACRSGCRLLVGGGIAIEFDAGVDPTWVARLVTAVGALQ